jgi:hypothetical protein
MLVKQDKSLKVGSRVSVRWGYGLNFRASGIGKIVKVFEKSVQVELESLVPSPYGGQGWPAGFVLKGIPRYTILNDRWDVWNSVTPLD